MTKTTFFNLIILDESGSMSSSKAATISGCNETLNVCRKLQQEHSDTQRTLVSIFAFQSDSSVPSRYLCKNIPAESVKDITGEVYEPWGNTPLLDAVGSTLTDLEAITATHEDAIATVTIITDGYENSSSMYSFEQVMTIISRLKEKGWTFNLIGANIDAARMAQKLNIDNALQYVNDSEGTGAMWHNYNDQLYKAREEAIRREAAMQSPQERESYRKKASRKFFSR